MASAPTNEPPRLFASIDVETDGNNPAQNSMLAIGVAFLSTTGDVVDVFERNILPTPDRKQDDVCMKTFWNLPENQKAWAAIHTNQVTPAEAMSDLSAQLRTLSKDYTITWCGFPACFDWMFLKVYYESFGPTDKHPIGYLCTDIDSQMDFAVELHKTTYGKLVERFAPPNPHPHNALSDAITQGQMFINMKKSFENTVLLDESDCLCTFGQTNA